jgi:hypothetical protein
MIGSKGVSGPDYHRGFITAGFLESTTQVTSVRMQLSNVEYHLNPWSSNWGIKNETYYQTTNSVSNSFYTPEGVKGIAGIDMESYLIYQMTLDASCY